MIYTATAHTPSGIYQIAAHTNPDVARTELRVIASYLGPTCQGHQVTLDVFKRITPKAFARDAYKPVPQTETRLHGSPAWWGWVKA